MFDICRIFGNAEMLTNHSESTISMSAKNKLWSAELTIKNRLSSIYLEG